MKYLKKFNEGFLDFFKKEKQQEEPEVKGEKITVEGSRFWASKSENSDTYFVYQDNYTRQRPIATVIEYNGNLILQITKWWGSTYINYEAGMSGEQVKRIKVKSVEQALKYLEKVKQEYVQAYLNSAAEAKRKEQEKLKFDLERRSQEEEGKFDKDISNEEF